MMELLKLKLFHKRDVFDAAVKFAKTEALYQLLSQLMLLEAINEALKCKETGEEKLFYLIYGHGYFDMAAR